MEKQGFSATVVNVRFVKPLDEPLILSLAAQHGRVLTVEENVVAGGFGSAVLELLADRDLFGVQVKRLGIPDIFVEHGTQDHPPEEIRIGRRRHPEKRPGHPVPPGPAQKGGLGHV